MSQIQPMLKNQKAYKKKKQDEEKKKIQADKKKNLYEQYASMYSSYPLIELTFKDQAPSTKIFIKNSSMTRMDEIQNIKVYLPGYLRLKFKNFNSFHLEEYYAQYNATMIFTIYYGAVLQHLVKTCDLKKQDKKRILKSLQNQLVLTLGNEDSIQLAEMVEDEEKKSNINENEPKLIIKPSIQTSVRLDDKKKFLNYTIRKNFKVLLESHVYLTPFERINTILDVSVRPLTIQINQKNSNSKTSITFHLNLLNSTEQKTDKILITEAKKFGKYGLILPELDAIYFSKESDLVGKQSGKSKEEDDIERLKSEMKRVFSEKSYIHMRQSYRKYISKYKNKFRDFCPQSDNEERECLQSSERSQYRRFFFKQTSEPFEPFSKARFIIPLYKFPFTSIATIFFPLWLLAILNLGIFFQEQGLGSRIASIASLMIAFIAFIPTIREQIPPGPKVVLIEIIVYAVTMTSFLALLQSLDIIFAIDEFNRAEKQKDPYFLTSLIIDILSFLIIAIFTVLHYAVWQKKYKTDDKNPEKKQLYKQRWHNFQCEQQVTKKFSISSKFIYLHKDEKDEKNEKELKESKILDKMKEETLEKVQKPENEMKPKTQQKGYQKENQHGIFEISVKDPKNISFEESKHIEQQVTETIMINGGPYHK